MRRMTTQAWKLMTADEFASLGDIGPADLIRGKVVCLTRPRPRHGRVAQNVSRALDDHVRVHKLGQVYGSEIGYLVERDPDTVRAPDVSFVRAEVVAGHDEDEWYPHGPDLAVEVLSPTDRPADVQEKARQWLDAGGRSVWIVDPARREVTVVRADGGPERFSGDRKLRDEAVLPGFFASLSTIFD